MQSTFNADYNCRIYMCGVCKYLYTEYYDYDKQLHNQEKPFIKMEEPLLRTVERDYGPDTLERINQYACPICGVLQIDTDAI